MIENLLELPDPCQVKNKIPKKDFYEMGELKYKDIQIFTKNIEQITWQYTIKPETTNIALYKDQEKVYEEIEIINIQLRKDTKISEISNIIFQTIPYPQIQIYEYLEYLKIIVAPIRENKADSSKVTLIDAIDTPWINTDKLDLKDKRYLEKIKIDNLTHENLYKLYNNIWENTVKYTTLKETELDNIFLDDIVEIEKIRNKIREINLEISILENKIDEETQFNKNVELNIERQDCIQERNNLIQKLNGD